MKLSRYLLPFFKLTVFVFSSTIFFSCASSKPINEEIVNCKSEKITFDLTGIDDRGLIGYGENKKGLDFEFCIPNQPDLVKKVLTLDSSLKKLASKGRSNCSEQHVLITGSTYNKNFKKLLCKIAQLEYVKEINQTYWE